MASLKRAAKIGQITHRERPEPQSRAHLGHMERKKDYKLRAQDYNTKKEALQKLRQQALNKNPDEFYFHMIRSHLNNDGVHKELALEPDEDTILQRKLGDLRNLSYIKHKLSVEMKKIDKLKSSLHVADTSTNPMNTHTIFLDDDEVKNFDLAEYFDTPEEFVGRKFNRPRMSTLKTDKVNAYSKKDVEAANRSRKSQYNELSKRLKRAKELRVVVEKLETRKNVADSKSLLKPKRVTRGESMKAPVYKWIYERKK